MADTESVVSLLKKTRKGRIFSPEKTNPMIYLNPNFSDIVNVLSSHYSSNRDGGGTSELQQYSTYLSPERKQRNMAIPDTKTHETECYMLPQHYISPERKPDLEEIIQNDCTDMLENKAKQRLENMREQYSKIALEYENCLKEIELQVECQLNERKSLLLFEESAVDKHCTDEMKKFQQLTIERSNLAEIHKKQTDDHRRTVQDALHRREQMIRTLKEMKINIAEHLERADRLKGAMIASYQELKNTCSVPQDIVEILKKFIQVYTQLARFVNVAVTGNGQHLDEQLVQTASTMKVLETLKETMEEEKHRLMEEEEKKKVESLKIAAPDSILSPRIPATGTVTNSSLKIGTAIPALAPIESYLLKNISLYSTPDLFSEYLRLQMYLTDTSRTYESLERSSTNDQKTFKFDLYKIINTTINAISDESPKHLLSKVTKIFNLLLGEAIEVSGRKISSNAHPQALSLCKDLLTTNLVLQGASQIASNYSAAFPVAVVIVSVCSLFPECGELLIAHFYQRCPYLVPFYVPQTKILDSVEYHRLMGYTVQGSTVEDQDKYVTKLSGFVRLYAAIVQTEVPEALGERVHFHDIEYAWRWFVGLITLEPRSTVTATVIYHFLDMAGHAMLKRFGKQFRKILLILYKDYMNKIFSVTTDEGKPAAMRLKLFLDECVKEGRIKEPEGLLTRQWWSSY